MKIVCDTSTLYSPSEGEQLGIQVLPLCVTINDKTYREFQDISSNEFVNLIKEGSSFPSSSQPAIGEVLECFEQEEEILYITMADGLSGTYQSALGAREGMEHHEHVHIMNSKTLCGPHRYLVQKAMKLKEEGLSLKGIVNALEDNMKSMKSFLIPQDFNYLKRGGRLTPIAATIGGMLKIVPILVQSDDGKKLEKAGVKRTMKGAINEVIDSFKKHGISAEHIIYISHATTLAQVQEVSAQIKESLANIMIEVLDLSPAFITQGGPGCIAIQMIKK